MRELLVRYLLGELDAGERAQLEQRLNESPELRQELVYLRKCFASSCDADPPATEPPRGLAERTSQRVSDLADAPDDGGLFDVASGRVAAFAGSIEPPAGPLGWSFADITVAAGVCLAVSMLLAPALRNSQDASRRQSCTNHQREAYFLVARYADRHNGLLPTVKPNEFAGMFVVRLMGEENISQDDARKMLLCSGSPLGEAVRRGEAEVYIPREVQIRAGQGDSLAQLFRTSTGSYAVPLPSICNNRYAPQRLYDTEEFPIFADAPNFNLTGIESPNHYGGVLITYSRGCVKFQPTAVEPRWQDPIYINVLGQPEAGRGEHDSVLVSGDRTPGLAAIGLNQ